MTEGASIGGILGVATHTARDAWATIRRKGPSQIQFWFIAACVGIAAGWAAVGFRYAIAVLQEAVYGADDVLTLATYATALPWYWIVAIPVAGGLVVGLILNRFTPDGRARAVAEVIEGAALSNGRVEVRAGIASTAAHLVTLSTGGSSGREGPAVHLASVIATWVSRRINADGITGRDLLGCAVASAVSASFNAPIAGALFALEVVLRHFAVHAFAPIAIASVSGAVIARSVFGENVEFTLMQAGVLRFYVELPAFLMLGLLSGLVAVAYMRAIFLADDVGNGLQERLGLHRVLRPAVAGLLLGIIAVRFPHIIGVGYETTYRALSGGFPFGQAVVFAVVKAVAVAITLAGRMGGGIFSPSLMMGALTGLAFGHVATNLFPEVSGADTLYALAGMGAVAAAVLGAPISTTLIVFELTGNWQTGLAVMAAVSVSTALASRLVDRSFFLTQLERRGVKLAAGPQAYLLAATRVADVMRDRAHPEAASESACAELAGQGVYLDERATLEVALREFDASGWSFIPVVRGRREDGAGEIVGAVFQVDALRAYSRALAATAAEEHS